MTQNKYKISWKNRDKDLNKKESMDQKDHLKDHTDKFIIPNCI